MTEPVDWQARALAAEAELAELRGAVEALAKRVKSIGKPPKEKREVYVVEKQELAEVQRKIAGLDSLHASGTMDMPTLEALMGALANVRALAQGASVAEYRGGECAAVQTMLKAYKPSQIARALFWAGRDSFWATQALNFNIVATKIPGWLASAENNRAAPSAKAQAVDDTRAKIEAAIARLETAKPKPLMLLADLKRDLSTSAAHELPELLARVAKECEKRLISSQEEQRR